MNTTEIDDPGTGADALSTPPVEVSPDAAEYARNHRLWGSLVLVKSLILRDSSLVASVNVALFPVSDAPDRSVICFTVHTSASVPEILAFDERLRDLIIDHVPAQDQIHFAFRFDFD
jgi:hypothetical protein